MPTTSGDDFELDVRLGPTTVTSIADAATKPTTSRPWSDICCSDACCG